MSLIQRIDSFDDELRRSERKVAEVVRATPEEIVRLSISDLARRAGVSEPTVVRFCRALGFSGFQDFKVGLAHDLGTRERPQAVFADVGLTADDDLPTISRKVIGVTSHALATLGGQLDQRQLGRAVDLLLVARRIDFYGFGASGIVAADGHHKFFRLCIPTNAYADPHMQAMSAATLSSGDAVVAISKTGETAALLDSVQIAQSFGATVVALTSTGSSLARLADIPLTIDVREDTGFATPMTSRIAHLVVIDILAVAVAARRPNAVNRLASIKQALRPLKAGSPGRRHGRPVAV